MVCLSFLSFLFTYPQTLRSPLGLLEYVRSRVLFYSVLHVCTSGVFLCIRCSGIHRGMGTHISKVKSIDLDAWTPEQMEACVSPLLTPSNLIDMQDRTYKNGAIALPTYTGKHTSNQAMFLQISEYRSSAVASLLFDITITISVR
jgi:hypothetical protein